MHCLVDNMATYAYCDCAYVHMVAPCNRMCVKHQLAGCLFAMQKQHVPCRRYCGVSSPTWAVAGKLVDGHHHRHTVLPRVLYVAHQVAAALLDQVNVRAGVGMRQRSASDNRRATSVHLEGTHGGHNDCAGWGRSGHRYGEKAMG